MGVGTTGSMKKENGRGAGKGIDGVRPVGEWGMRERGREEERQRE